METKELLQAISEIMDEKLTPAYKELEITNKKLNTLEESTNTTNQRLDRLESKLNELDEKVAILEIKHDITHKGLTDIQLNMKISERAIRKDISKLQDAEETLVTVLEMKGILPKAK